MACENSVKTADQLKAEWTLFLSAKHVADVKVVFPDYEDALEYLRNLRMSIDWAYQEGRACSHDERPLRVVHCERGD